MEIIAPKLGLHLEKADQNLFIRITRRMDERVREAITVSEQVKNSDSGFVQKIMDSKLESETQVLKY